MNANDDAMLNKLRSRFRERLARELPKLCTHIPYTHKNQQALMQLAHSLAGAGGTFGFPCISTKATELENLLRQNQDEQEITTALHKLIATISAAIPDASSI